MDRIVFSLERTNLYGYSTTTEQIYNKPVPTAEAYNKINIQFMQDALNDLLNFFWDLTYIDKGKPSEQRREVIIYPMKLYESGYGIDPESLNSYLPDAITTLNEWVDPKAPQSPNQRAFILDPTKSDPLTAAKIIGSLIGNKQLLIFRIRGMGSDE